MARFQTGVLGGFEGKVGTVVGGRWKGIDYMRHKGRKSNKPPTQSQLEQRARFALLTSFIHKLSRLFMKSFKEVPEMTGINAALSYNYQHALTGVYPSFAIDFSKVLISQGILENGILPSANPTGNGVLTFGWTDNTGIGLANADDKAVMVIYCPETKQALYKTGAGRNSGTDTLNAANFTGKTVETWLTFASAGEKEYSSSIYTGQVVVV
jgi:hypothetical protein